ncbi:MAG: helix-turn-helix domain-containing protein [Firmicutes bacterium]|nr:helix-turn-helix domain-containing protein [Bacillota bacterium]
MESPAKRLTKLREEKGLSQRQLAKVVGIHQATYRLYEVGTEASYENLIKIAKFYNVTVGYLVGAEDY